MSKQIQRRRGSSSNHQNFTGAAGEITIDTTNNRPVIHNGVLGGGFTGVIRNDIFSNGYPSLLDPLGQERFTSTNAQTEVLNVAGEGRFHIDAVDAYIQDPSQATPFLAHSGSVLLGQASRVSTSTEGFPYVPQVTGVPTTHPQVNAGFCPLAINTGNMRLYVHVPSGAGKWWFASLTST